MLDERLSAVERIAVDAGARILAIYSTNFEVVSKSDDSPLTAADMASHKAIVAGLEALTPDIPVLSEESSGLSWETRQRWERYWLVDPLDGTREFVKRNGEFTVNIALIEDQRPVMGVVYVPVQGTVYLGHVGHGAWKRDSKGHLHPIKTRAQGDPLVIACSRSHPSESLAKLLDGFEGAQRRPLGSSLKFCYIAEGQVDFYPRLGLTSEWDTAAAQAVMEAAGGSVVKLDGEPLRYNTKDSLLNPHFLVFGDPSLQPRVMEMLAELGS